MIVDFGFLNWKAGSEPVEHRAQGELRLGVAPADAGHDLGAFFRSDDVHGGRLKTARDKMQEKKP